MPHYRKDILLVGSASPRRVFFSAVALFFLPVLALAARWALCLAHADSLFRQSTVTALQEAIRVTPDNASFFDQLAYVNDLAGGPGTLSRQALLQSVSLNPRNSDGWIVLGLGAEQSNDLAKAEQYLRNAASVDKQFGPSWALANFYFRRNDFSKFVPPARNAVQMSYSDPRPIFSLAWVLSQDSGAILERVVTRDPKRLTQYLNFLTSEEKLEEAKPVSELALRLGSALDAAPPLARYMKKLVDKNDADGAVQVWNGLCRNGWVKGQAFDVEHGDSLTNGDFAQEPTQMAFGWFVHRQKGITIIRYDTPPGLRITLSGSQAEHVELLYQYLPVIQGRRYVLTAKAAASKLPVESGLRWLVFDSGKGSLISPGSPHIAASEWVEQRIRFQVPESANLVRLALQYHRTKGTTPIEGWVAIRNVRLAFDGTPPSPAAGEPAR